MTPRRAILFFKIGVSLSLIAYLAFRLDWHDFGEIVGNIEPWRYCAAVVVLATSYALNSARWQLLLAGQGLSIRIRSAISIDLVALFFNAFLPGSTGGDAVRVYYASMVLRGELTRLVATVIVDRLVGLAILLTFGYLAYVLRPGIAARFELLQEVLKWLPFVLSAVLACGTLLLFAPRRRVPVVFVRAVDRAFQIPIIGRLVEFGGHLRRKPQSLVLAAVITVAAQLIGFLAAYLIALSLGITLDYLEIVLVMAITQIAVSLPISVAGHGVREVVLIGIFSAMDVASGRPEIAIAFSLLFFSAQLIWSLVGGVWFAIRPRHSRL